MVLKKVGLPGSRKRSKAGLDGEHHQVRNAGRLHAYGLKLSPVSNKWTMAHGHLLAMGGICTVDPSVEDDGQVDPRSPVLTIEQYTKTKEKEKLERKLCKISEEDIKDRSKGDILSKLIAILQTTWFILQCIARGQQRLTLTELELVTLALASLNAITYVFWWHKPLGVQVPIRIYFEPEAIENVNVEDADAEPGITASYILSGFGNEVGDVLAGIRDYFRDVNGLFSFLIFFLIILPLTLIFLVLLFLPLPFSLGIVFLLNILKTKPVTQQEVDDSKLIAAQIVLALRQLRYKFTSFIARISEMWLRKFLDSGTLSGFYIGWVLVIPILFVFLLVTTILLLPFFTLLFLVSFIFTAVFGIITTSTVTPNSLHVPSFYAPTTKSDKYSRMVVFALFGVIFGGLHCIGWNFTYPTAFEQRLWRASSLAITAIPLIVAPIDYLLENYKLDKGFLKVIRLTLDLIMTILLFIYVPARLTLIGQAFALLRKQPQDAFLAVDWNQYIPHLF